MKRRSFLKSCGGAIAALMMPFGLRVKTEIIGWDTGDMGSAFTVYEPVSYVELYWQVKERIACGFLAEHQKNATEKLKSLTVIGHWKQSV